MLANPSRFLTAVVTTESTEADLLEQDKITVMKHMNLATLVTIFLEQQ